MNMWNGPIVRCPKCRAVPSASGWGLIYGSVSGECPVCFEVKTNLKIIDCRHPVCTDCLENAEDLQVQMHQQWLDDMESAANRPSPFDENRPNPWRNTLPDLRYPMQARLSDNGDDSSSDLSQDDNGPPPYDPPIIPVYGRTRSQDDNGPPPYDPPIIPVYGRSRSLDDSDSSQDDNDNENSPPTSQHGDDEFDESDCEASEDMLSSDLLWQPQQAQAPPPPQQGT